MLYIFLTSATLDFQQCGMSAHARIQRGTGGLEPPPPPKMTKNIGFSSNTGPIPGKIAKLPSQHSIYGHRRHATETPAYCGTWILPPLIIKKMLSYFDPLWQNFLDPRMTTPQRLRPLIVVLGSSLPLSTKKNAVKVGPPLTKLSGSRMATHKG